MTKFTEAERTAMKDRNRELKGADTEAEQLAKIAAMPAADRVIAERLHTLLRETFPELTPKTWYGMPAYYHGGKMLCFFQAASKFKARYGMVGFSDAARLDDGAMWPVYHALAELTPEAEARITALVKQAIG
jgi:uncharacterized protein YdhG (YjbR/CyaY superfamily)